tara:strand:+ start:998 stop:1714 length:717 start_codon:yes stop_codon:yes gene_type:complete
MNEHLPKRILVTGGGTGIGLGIVRHLRDLNRDVIVVGRRPQPLEAAAALGAIVHAWDITDNVQGLFDLVGPIDGLVLNAGQYRHEMCSQWSVETWTDLWRVNTLAAVLLSTEFANRLVGPGAIVAVASTLAKRPAPGAAAYAASKAALLSVIQHLALELAPRGIRANAVLPGIVPTAMTTSEQDSAKAQDHHDYAMGLHPIGRLGRPSDVASTVVHALANPWMTGANLNIDGGLLVRE